MISALGIGNEITFLGQWHGSVPQLSTVLLITSHPGGRFRYVYWSQCSMMNLLFTIAQPVRMPPLRAYVNLNTSLALGSGSLRGLDSILPVSHPSSKAYSSVNARNVSKRRLTSISLAASVLTRAFPVRVPDIHRCRR